MVCGEGAVRVWWCVVRCGSVWWCVVSCDGEGVVVCGEVRW